jgi:hypothetical protein
MMRSVSRVTDRLEEAAAVLAGAGRGRPGRDRPGPGRDPQPDPGAATGTGLPGAPGEVTAALHRQRTAALDARAREVSSAAARLYALARDLRTAVAGYALADEAAHTRAARLEER